MTLFMTNVEFYCKVERNSMKIESSVWTPIDVQSRDFCRRNRSQFCQKVVRVYPHL